jgi:hypothetical protein
MLLGNQATSEGFLNVGDDPSNSLELSASTVMRTTSTNPQFSRQSLRRRTFMVCGVSERRLNNSENVPPLRGSSHPNYRLAVEFCIDQAFSFFLFLTRLGLIGNFLS